MKYLLRVLALPFVLGIIFIYHNYHVLRRGYFFILYGGEMNTYSAEDRVTIQAIYDELKNNRDGSQD